MSETPLNLCKYCAELDREWTVDLVDGEQAANAREYRESTGHWPSCPFKQPAAPSPAPASPLQDAINLCFSERNRWHEGDKEYVHWDTVARVLQGNQLAAKVRAEVGAPASGPELSDFGIDTRVRFVNDGTKPCSACGDGDTAQQYHVHVAPASLGDRDAWQKFVITGGRYSRYNESDWPAFEEMVRGLLEAKERELAAVEKDRLACKHAWEKARQFAGQQKARAEVAETARDQALEALRSAAGQLHAGGCDESTTLEECPNDACKQRVEVLALRQANTQGKQP